MKQEEEDYIKRVHAKNGSEYSNKRVKEFKKSQKEFKTMKKDLRKKDTIIKNLEKKLAKQKKQIETLKTKNAKIKLAKKNSELGKNIFLQDVKQEELRKLKPLINRIQNNMEFNREYTKSDIKKEFFIANFQKIDMCMDYLVKNEVVSKSVRDGYVRYVRNG